MERPADNTNHQETASATSQQSPIFAEMVDEFGDPRGK